MNTEVKSSIHNRFDIYSTNVETGETKQVAFAENIILNSMWTKLCSFLPFWGNIHYGTGTGTLSATRTSLFSHLATKASVAESYTTVLPTVSIRRKIVLNPEDNVGAVITELGLAYDGGSASLLTHAMLKDMNGNVVSITKTSAEVLTIYATVYTTITSLPNVELSSGSDNELIRYFTGKYVWEDIGYGPNMFYFGECSYDGDLSFYGVHSDPVIGTSPDIAITGTIDVANKKVTTGVARVPVDSCNGHITEICFGNTRAAFYKDWFRLKLPSSGIYEGLPLAGVNVGTGDGVKRRFFTPSRNVRNSSLVVYKDGTVEAGRALSVLKGSSLITLKRNISGVVGGMGYPTFARTASTFAVSTDTTPFIYVADYVNDMFTKRANPVSAPPAGGVGRPALSADGNILAIPSTVSPYIHVYDWTAGAWVKRANPSVLPAGAGFCCSLSDDGSVLAISHNTSPFVTVYDWTAGAWVKRANPTSLPSSGGKCQLSANGLVLAIVCNVSPFVYTYDWSGTAWTKRVDPTTLPTSGNSCSLSADGNVLAVAHSTTPFLYTYDWTAGAWVNRANATVLPVQTVNDCSLSSDGTILGFANSNWSGNAGSYSYYTGVYCFYDAVWTMADMPYNQIAMHTANCAVQPEGEFLMTIGEGSYELRRIDLGKTSILFDTPPADGAIITADYTVDGIHKTNQRVLDLSCSFTFGEPV